MLLLLYLVNQVFVLFCFPIVCCCCFSCLGPFSYLSAASPVFWGVGPQIPLSLVMGPRLNCDNCGPMKSMAHD